MDIELDFWSLNDELDHQQNGGLDDSFSDNDVFNGHDLIFGNTNVFSEQEINEWVNFNEDPNTISVPFLADSSNSDFDYLSNQFQLDDNDTDTIRFEQQEIDTNGGGFIETTLFENDSNPQYTYDSFQENLDNPFGLNYLDDVDLSDTTTLQPEDDIMPNFDQNDPNVIPDQVAGDPTSDMEHWEYQGMTNRCALFAQRSAIEALTNQEIDMTEFEAIATENGWFDDGTSPENMNKMLDYYGVKNEMSTGGSVDDLVSCLNQGGKAVVAVDGDEIWDPNHDSDIFAPNDPNHAIEVIGVDYSDPANPMVIINDSGLLDGCGEMVPVDQFVSAWEDSDRQMILAYPN